MKKIIIFNALDYGAIFLLAAAKRAGYTPLSASSPSRLWDNGAKEIILLNIDPKRLGSSVQYHPDLGIYLKTKIGYIQGFIFFPYDYWDKNNPGINLIMEYYTSEMREIALKIYNEKEWKKDEKASRYGQALRAALIKGSNDSWYEYEEVLYDAIDEIRTGQNRILIDHFVDRYEKMRIVTQSAINKIELNTKIKIPKSDVAYVYLDNISNFLDLSALRKHCLAKHPFLTVIQYRQHGKEKTWLLSNKKLAVNEFFQLGGDKYEILLDDINQEVLKYLQKIIAEITS